MTGDSGDRPCGRGRDCRTDAGSGLMGQEKGGQFTHRTERKAAALTPLPGQTGRGKGANSHTGQSWKTAALMPPRDRLRMGAGHFYAGAVVPSGGGFML